MRILLLEDEYSLRISIKEFLEDIGYDVDGYMNGQEAHDAIYDKQLAEVVIKRTATTGLIIPERTVGDRRNGVIIIADGTAFIFCCIARKNAMING